MYSAPIALVVADDVVSYDDPELEAAVAEEDGGSEEMEDGVGEDSVTDEGCHTGYRVCHIPSS